MKRNLLLPGILVTLMVLVVPAAWAAGGSQQEKTPGGEKTPGNPLMEAQDHYNGGLKSRDKAWKLEARAAESQVSAEREKLQDKAMKQYRRAMTEFQTAVQKNPNLHQAFSSLGYTLRKTGDYDSALEAYDKALAMAPDYTEAIEYRGEAYLELGRYDDAKQAYMTLFNDDRARADMLLAAMKRHVENSSAGSEGTDALADWIREREEVSGQVASLPELEQRKW